jgi:hypothetical protein
MTTTTTTTTSRAQRTVIFLEPNSRTDLDRCIAAGSELAGHSLTQSVIVRRALALLADHLHSLKTPSQERAERAELATVMR